jgi:hypothetical protein
MPFERAWSGVASGNVSSKMPPRLQRGLVKMFELARDAKLGELFHVATPSLVTSSGDTIEFHWRCKELERPSVERLRALLHESPGFKTDRGQTHAEGIIKRANAVVFGVTRVPSQLMSNGGASKMCRLGSSRLSAPRTPVKQGVKRTIGELDQVALDQDDVTYNPRAKRALFSISDDSKVSRLAAATNQRKGVLELQARREKAKSLQEETNRLKRELTKAQGEKANSVKVMEVALAKENVASAKEQAAACIRKATARAAAIMAGAERKSQKIMKMASDRLARAEQRLPGRAEREGEIKAVCEEVQVLALDSLQLAQQTELPEQCAANACGKEDGTPRKQKVPQCPCGATFARADSFRRHQRQYCKRLEVKNNVNAVNSP